MGKGKKAIDGGDPLDNVRGIMESFKPYEESLFVLGKKPDAIESLLAKAKSPSVSAESIKRAILDIADIELSSEKRIVSADEAMLRKRSDSTLESVHAEKLLENLAYIAELLHHAESRNIPFKKLYSELRIKALETAPPKSLVREDGPIMTIDVGGTEIKYAVYDQDTSKFSHKGSVPTPQSRGDELADKERFLDALQEIAGDLAKRSGLELTDFAGMGLLIPAPIELGTGYIEWLPFLNVRDFDLRAELLERLGMNASIGGDVTLETLGAAKELDLKGKLNGTILGVSAGTSIGLGVIARTRDGHRILSAPDMGFRIELIRGYSVGQSMGVFIPTPDHHIGWKVAARGIINTLAQRLREVKETRMLDGHTIGELSRMAESDPEAVYDVVLSASEEGDLLARRLMTESLDTDSDWNYTGARLKEHLATRAVSAIMKVDRTPLSEADISHVTPKIVDRAARDGDVLAQDILREAGYYLGASLSIVLPFIKPDKVYLFGGISKSKIWRQAVEDTIRNNSDFKGKFIRKGENTHLLGAATLLQLDLKFRSGGIVN